MLIQIINILIHFYTHITWANIQTLFLDNVINTLHKRLCANRSKLLPICTYLKNNNKKIIIYYTYIKKTILDVYHFVKKNNVKI